MSLDDAGQMINIYRHPTAPVEVHDEDEEEESSAEEQVALNGDGRDGRIERDSRERFKRDKYGRDDQYSSKRKQRRKGGASEYTYIQSRDDEEEFEDDMETEEDE